MLYIIDLALAFCKPLKVNNSRLLGRAVDGSLTTKSTPLDFGRKLRLSRTLSRSFEQVESS